MALTFTNNSGAPIGLWDTSSVHHVVAALGGSVTIEPTVSAQDLIAAYVSAGYATTTEASAPVSTESPAITGAEAVGETIISDSGTWTGAPAPTYAYQWQSSDDGTTGWKNISGAKSATYEIQAADEAKFLRCTVTATNALGSVKAQSKATGAIAEASAPVNTVAPAISGTETVGQTLTTTTGTWTGTPTITYTYQWQNSVDGEGSWLDITDADEATYLLDAADEGLYVRCVVTATNSEGTDTANSNVIGPVVDPE